jgi:hypothetical protein
MIENLITLFLFGVFILVAFRMGYMAGQAKETLIKVKELPEPVAMSDDYIDEEWAEEDE